MEQNALTERALASRLGVSQKQVNKLVKGLTPNPGIEAFEVVCKRFNVPWSYFHALGPPDMDLGAYQEAHALETQFEALRAQVDERIGKVEKATEKADRDPPSGAHRRARIVR